MNASSEDKSVLCPIIPELDHIPWDWIDAECISWQYWWLSATAVTQVHLLAMEYCSRALNTLRPRQDGRHFADDIFTCIFFNENCCILNKFSLKYVRKGPIDNNPALVQIMAWRRSGDKPLSEPMMVSLLTHICVTRPQWVNHWYELISFLITPLCIFIFHLTPH